MMPAANLPSISLGGALPHLLAAAWAGSIGMSYRLMRGLLRSRQPAAGTAIRAREPAAVAGRT
jgi:hypothetical protein